MSNRHAHNIEQLKSHLERSGPSEQPLSAAAYVNEVSRHLARIRQQPAASASRRI